MDKIKVRASFMADGIARKPELISQTPKTKAQKMKITEIISEKEYANLTQFSEKEIQWLEDRIKTRSDGKYGVECVVRGKNDDGDYFELKPEEVVRQLYAHRLIEKLGYEKDLLEFEVPAFHKGREIEQADKRIDIAIYKDKSKEEYRFIIEVKRPLITDENHREAGQTTPYEQMQSYCRQNLPELGVLANGGNMLKFYSKRDNYTEELTTATFPKPNEDLEKWQDNLRFTLKKLYRYDRLKNETLKTVITDVEQRFAANDSSDKSFDEILKLIYCKLYDEFTHNSDADYISREVNKQKRQNPQATDIECLNAVDDTDFSLLEFRADSSEDENKVAERISKLFDNAQKHWKGAFLPNTKLDMQPSTIKSCVLELYNVKLFNSNLEVVDEAFEYLVNKNQKGEMGQYFTPRYVIDMCVRMLNPKREETMIDTASGSCGFPMHTILHVWDKRDNLTTANRAQWEKDYVRDKVYAIDFSEKAVRIGRILNIITGDGNTNVLYLNTLDYNRWESQFKRNPEWYAKYNDGFSRLESLCNNNTSPYEKFNFDILMANPPFAGDLDDRKTLIQYDLAKNAKGVMQSKVGRDILFIERNLNFLKPGGRMAIVLPQGRFNNSSDKYIRDYIEKQCRILAVVGLHGNLFKPHTGTKTSVLFVQKWTDEESGLPNINDKEKVTYRFHLTDGNKRVTKKEMEDDIANREFRLIESQKKIEADEKFNGTKHQSTIFIDDYNQLSDDDKKLYQEHDKRHEDYDVYVDYPIFFATMQEPSKDNSGEKIYVTENYVTWTKYTYSVKNGELESTPIEQLTNWNTTYFVKDLFVADNGELDSHKKWIEKPVRFALKKSGKKKNDNEDAEIQTISLDEYFSLPASERKLYKEILDDCENLETKEIGLQEYNQLSKEEQKYYLPAEDVKEFSNVRLKDTHGHIFVKHDLFNHDPKLDELWTYRDIRLKGRYSKDGIAEAFTEFAKREQLSFF